MQKIKLEKKNNKISEAPRDTRHSGSDTVLKSSELFLCCAAIAQKTPHKKVKTFFTLFPETFCWCGVIWALWLPVMVAGLPSPHTHVDTQKAAKRTCRSVNGGRRNKKPFLLADSAGFLFLCVRAAYQTSLSAHVCVFCLLAGGVPLRALPSLILFLLSSYSLLPDPCCFSPPCFKMHVAVFPAFQARASHETAKSASSCSVIPI